MRLAIITTHPIQYYAPVFKLLHERGKIDIMIFYTWGEKSKEKYDPGFRTIIKWDVPLLEGYPFRWMENTANDPGTHHFRGIINPTLTQEVEQWKPDAVLVFGWAFQSHLEAIRYFKGKMPIYFRGDSTLLDNGKGVKNLLKSVFLKWLYRHIDHAFYVGTKNKEYLKKYGLKDGQLSFTPHAVDNERFAADRRIEAMALRDKLFISDDDVLVLFAGKMEDKKSPLELLEAFLSLKKKGIHLLYAGNGDLESELKLKAANAPNVHFLDFQNQTQMPVIYQACDLFCLPSKGPGETWGLAVNEAMACGKAVLVSDKAGCCADLVKSNMNGQIFKSGNAQELKDCLDSLTQSKGKLAGMGRNSTSMIKDWSFANIADAIERKLSEQSTSFR